MEGKIIAVLLHSTGARKFSERTISETRSRILRLFPDATLFSTFEFPDAETVSGGVVECAKQIFDRTPCGRQDSIAVLSPIAPLLDARCVEEALRDHFQYFAHYTYGEDLPGGILPDFLSKEFCELAGPEAYSAADLHSLREHVYRKINEYDVEIYFRLPDLRKYRIDLSCSTDRSEHLAEGLLAFDAEAPFDKLEQLLIASPELLRPAPSWIELELTSRRSVDPVFLPKRENGDDANLSEDAISRLLHEISVLPFENDVTVCLGGFGDPVSHPGFESLLAALVDLKQVDRVFVETYGVDLNEKMVQNFDRLSSPEKLSLILRLTTLDAKRYERLYRSGRYEDAMRTLRLLEDALRGTSRFSVYAEILKIKEVEDEIEAYFDRFEKSPVQVILQKYNRYIDRLDERRVSDLTPLHRDFCWHLARDLYITGSGKIAICKQDPFADRAGSQGELLEEGFAPFWRLAPHHAASIRSEWKSIPMPCLECDEWYTFNG